MNIIVFSKDRACQLELFLTSFLYFVKNSNKYNMKPYLLINNRFKNKYNIKVLYTFSTLEFKDGYDKLIKTEVFNEENKKNILFFKEYDFSKNVFELINLNKKNTVFFVDDNIFIRPFDFFDWQQDLFEKDNDILCRSLRLNYCLDYCYPAKKEINKRPEFDENGVFNWENQECDYGYPMSLDGHIFRTDQIVEQMKLINFKNPNSLEGRLVLHPIKCSKMVCYKKSIIINNPANRVQTNNFNYCGKYDAKYINSHFLKNKIIDMRPFQYYENTACHVELPINLM